MANENDVIRMGNTDWIKIRYNEVSEDELFWLQTTLNDFNSPMRKIDETTALHLREQRVVGIETGKVVYIKEQ